MEIEFDVTLFRDQFAYFADSTKYPDAELQAYFDSAACYISTQDYGVLSGACRLRALNAMTAHLCRLHELILSGQTPGIVSSSNVGGVSVSLVPPPFGTDQWAWWLSLTPYGSQVQALLSTKAVGGLYVGGSLERSGYRKIGGGF